MIFNHALLRAGSLGMEWKVGKMLLAFFLKFEALQDLMAHFMIEFSYFQATKLLHVHKQAGIIGILNDF
jgi:hypothetical protein